MEKSPDWGHHDDKLQAVKPLEIAVATLCQPFVTLLLVQQPSLQPYVNFLPQTFSQYIAGASCKLNLLVSSCLTSHYRLAVIA